MDRRWWRWPGAACWGGWNKVPVESRSLTGNQASLNCLFELLATQGWLERDGESRATDLAWIVRGADCDFVRRDSFVFANVQSLSTLLFGNARRPRVDESGVELLVNRGMNVWGSGGAHKTYFKKVDEIIIEIFNRPLARQPQGICDMGCGDGTFLEHLHEVVKQKTARGKVLEQHPLVLVGADFNKVARRVAKQHLRKAGIAGVPRNCGGHQSSSAVGQRSRGVRPRRTRFAARAFVPRSQSAVLAAGKLCTRQPSRGNPRERLHIWARKFRRTSWKKIWCGIYGGGRLMWGALGCWCWSCILCRPKWPRRICASLPWWLMTERMDSRISIWWSCRFFSTARGKRDCKRMIASTRSSLLPSWLP